MLLSNATQVFWARVIRKYFIWLFRYLNLVWETWNWKSIKNTWSIEAKILVEKLEIQAHFKVSFLRRNAEMPRIKNFRAFKSSTKLVFCELKIVFYHSSSIKSCFLKKRSSSTSHVSFVSTRAEAFNYSHVMMITW